MILYRWSGCKRPLRMSGWQRLTRPRRPTVRGRRTGGRLTAISGHGRLRESSVAPFTSSAVQSQEATSDVDIGDFASAVVFRGRPHVFYVGIASDTTDGVRDAHWNGSTWVVTPFGIADAHPPHSSLRQRCIVLISDAHPLDASITDGLEEWAGP
jgi:hypothetical protein